MLEYLQNFISQFRVKPELDLSGLFAILLSIIGLCISIRALNAQKDESYLAHRPYVFAFTLRDIPTGRITNQIAIRVTNAPAKIITSYAKFYFKNKDDQKIITSFSSIKNGYNENIISYQNQAIYPNTETELNEDFNGTEQLIKNISAGISLIREYTIEYEDFSSLHKYQYKISWEYQVGSQTWKAGNIEAN